MTDPDGGLRPAHLCHSFSPLSETFIYDSVTELERQGATSSVVTFKRRLAEERPFPRVLLPPLPAWIGLKVKWNLSRARRDFAGTLLHQMGPRRRAARRLLSRARPTVLHAHFGPMGVLAAPLAEELGIPLVTTFYGYDVSRLPRRSEWRDAYERLWPTLSAAAVLSEEMRGAVGELGCPPERIHVVHLGIPRGLEYRPPSGPVRRWVSVGRLVEKKGHLDTLRAFARVAEEHPDLTLRIVGDGPLRESIEREIAAAGLEDRIELLGALPRARALEEMRGADAFVLSSRTGPDGDREGTPTTLIEAAATGLPSLSTRHAGIPDIFAPGNRELLAEEGDVDGIAERMIRLVTAELDELREIAERGRRHVEAHFDLATETRKLVGLYGGGIAETL